MQWHPITPDLPNDVKYSSNLLLWSKSLIHLDFNPEGVVDGHWCDGGGNPDGFWEGAIWNNDQDCFDTEIIKPTHYAIKQGPTLEEIK